jgi:hypothetical protein
VFALPGLVEIAPTPHPELAIRQGLAFLPSRDELVVPAARFVESMKLWAATGMDAYTLTPFDEVQRRNMVRAARCRFDRVRASRLRGVAIPMDKPTLIVHTTYFPVATRVAEAAEDPELAAARALGLDLYDLLTRRRTDPLSWGAGVPVRIATRHDRVDPDEAELVVVIPVLGELSHARDDVRRKVIAAMRSWREPAHVLPVLTSEVWRDSESTNKPEDERIPVKPLLTELYTKDDPRQATLDEIVLALARLLAGDDQLATRLFISHAKGDLDGTERAAEEIRDHVQRRTTGAKPFFDQVSLLAGEDLDAQLEGNAERGVLIAVRGDSYSSRSWCQRELLKAKRQRLPILTVEVLSSGEHRSSAYSGNGPTVVWKRGEPKAAAARVVTLAMVECLRSLLFLAEAKRIASAVLPSESVVQIARAPELLDIPAFRGGTEGVVIVLHPDPELPVHERDLLREADKRLHTVTPTTAFSGAIGRALRAPLDGRQVALSLSEDKLEGPDGVRHVHVHDATVFLARSLLGAGAAIAYGGDFRQSGYTELLAQLVAAYNRTARKPADLLHSYLAAPAQKPGTWKYAHTAHHLGAFGSSRAEALLEPPPSEAWPSPHRAALYFSDMRRVMAKHTKACVVLCGATTPKAHDPKGYGGRYPGVVEEAWRTLEAERPLYVAGGFGGAAALVADLLEHPDSHPRQLDEKTWAGATAWDDLVTAIDADPDVEKLGLPRTQLEIADKIRALGLPHLASDDASLRWNGLTIAENRTLFRTRDPLTITALVLKGLVGVAAREAQGKLRIELVEGDVTGATDLDVLVFPTFADLDLDGAGAALDRVSGGAAQRAHRSPGGPTPSATRTLGAGFLYAADLGEMNAATKDPVGRVRAAASATAAMARRYGFARVGLVTFLGNVADNLRDVIAAMLDGLRGAPQGAQLVWFERDPARAAMLASLLGEAQQAEQVELTRVVAASAASEPPRGKPRTLVAIRQDGDDLDIAVLVPQANGLAPNIRSLCDGKERARLAGQVHDATPPNPDLIERGTRIAELLFGAGATRTLEAVGDSELVIVHDASSSGLPYEALGWGEGQHRVTPATRGGIVRHLLAGVDADRGLPAPTHAGKLGVLLVINPREDLKEAEQEGDAILALLQRSPRVKVTELRRAAATVEAVLEGMANPSIDLIHYCGHAFYRGPGPDQSGLNCAGGELTLRSLQGLPRVPRLAIFNACQAGRVRGEPAAREPQAFAEFFLHAGVDAYLATFWLVSDKSAATFADELYKQLGLGAELGEAVVHARRVLQQGGLTDWANYVLYGRAGFRLVRGAGLPDGPAARAPAPWGRAEGKTIVACWPFAVTEAPAALSVTVTERIGGSERPVSTEGPIHVDRRDSWHEGTALVQWVATVMLKEPREGRAFRLRATAGEPIELGSADAAAPATRALASPTDELRALRTLLDQQPDRGRAILTRLMPSADPDQLRADIDKALETRAIWPFHVFTSARVDGAALAAFAAAYPLAAGIDRELAGDQRFQTKEDWGRYATASGAASFLIGAEVERPMSADLSNPAAELTHDVRNSELDGGGLSVALFADNGNGLPAAKAIAKQIVDSGLPYAFHLGDVYYGGAKHEFRDHFEAHLEVMFGRTDLLVHKVSAPHQEIRRPSAGVH